MTRFGQESLPSRTLKPRFPSGPAIHRERSSQVWIAMDLISLTTCSSMILLVGSLQNSPACIRTSSWAVVPILEGSMDTISATVSLALVSAVS